MLFSDNIYSSAIKTTSLLKQVASTFSGRKFLNKKMPKFNLQQNHFSRTYSKAFISLNIVQSMLMQETTIVNIYRKKRMKALFVYSEWICFGNTYIRGSLMIKFSQSLQNVQKLKKNLACIFIPIKTLGTDFYDHKFL